MHMHALSESIMKVLIKNNICICINNICNLLKIKITDSIPIKNF